MSVTVRGYSDDIIDVEGDISEEFVYGDDRDAHGEILGFSTGVVLRITYTRQGIWRILPVRKAEGVKITPAPEDDEDNYSDRAVLVGSPDWVVHGDGFAARAHP